MRFENGVTNVLRDKIKMYLRAFFCFNQVSYSLAHEASKSLPGSNYIIFTPNRVNTHLNSEVIVLKYNLFISFILLVLSSVSRNVEIVLPHAKGGRLIQYMARFSRRLSFIDDGMDTFREQPKNIDLSLIRKDSNYYTFDYPIPLASWVTKMNRVGVCEISTLLSDSKPTLNLEEHDCLVIESPGVTITNLPTKYERPFLISHPNYKKSNSTCLKIKSKSGLKCSVEKTIKNYQGDIVVGESMVLIFSLIYVKDKTKINIYLTQSTFNNLACLHKLFNSCGSVTIG